MRFSRLSSMLVSAAALALGAPALAASPAFSVVGTPNVLGNPPFVLGYEFTTSQVFSLSGLGFFDDGADGLAEGHDIGLYSAAGSLLASTTLGAGSSGTLIDGFRYSGVAPLLLAAGTYRIGATFATGSDRVFFANEGNIVTGIAGTSFGGARFAFGGTLADPTFSGGADGYLGPNLLLGAAVPEPASWALMIGGIGLVGGTLRRRRPTVRVTYA